MTSKRNAEMRTKLETDAKIHFPKWSADAETMLNKLQARFKAGKKLDTHETYLLQTHLPGLKANKETKRSNKLKDGAQAEGGAERPQESTGDGAQNTSEEAASSQKPPASPNKPPASSQKSPSKIAARHQQASASNGGGGVPAELATGTESEEDHGAERVDNNVLARAARDDDDQCDGAGAQANDGDGNGESEVGEEPQTLRRRKREAQDADESESDLEDTRKNKSKKQKRASNASKPHRVQEDSEYESDDSRARKPSKPDARKPSKTKTVRRSRASKKADEDTNMEVSPGEKKESRKSRYEKNETSAIYRKFNKFKEFRKTAQLMIWMRDGFDLGNGAPDRRLNVESICCAAKKEISFQMYNDLQNAFLASRRDPTDQ